VLELGAGLGLCALTAASLLRAEHRDVAAPLVTLTDFNSGLLAAAERCASENALSRLLCVARCDWADEASSADCEARWRGECNAEYFRVKACEAEREADDPWPRLAPGSLFDLILATEIVYESHAATTLPVLIRARLAPGGRFLTLMAVRDAELLRTFASLLCSQSSKLPRVLVTICSASRLPLPADCAGLGAVDGAPFAPGQRWMSATECEKEIAIGENGGTLQTAWLEVFRPTEDGPTDEHTPMPRAKESCCSRSARGLGCPCRLRLPHRSQLAVPG